MHAITLFTIILAILHLRAEYAKNLTQIYIFKPLTTLSIIALCLVQSPEVALLYQYVVLAGLVFSLGGDVFLMLPSDQFIKGLVSFLLAHICYIVAFSSECGFRLHLVYIVPIIGIGIIILRILLPHTGKMTVPVILYSIVILMMLWQALERWGIARSQSATLAVIGAILFVVSDLILAYNRFVKPFKSARLLNLSTYYCAQWLIALSV